MASKMKSRANTKKKATSKKHKNTVKRAISIKHTAKRAIDLTTTSIIPTHSQAASPDEDLWPEEQQALEDIKTGKTELVKYSGEDYLKHLDSLIDA